MAINKINDGLFFDKIKEIKLEKYFNASQIFNVGESDNSVCQLKYQKLFF
jgi:hypothetical protein